MRYHSQNLTEDDKKPAHTFWHGRAWLRLESDAKRHPGLGLHWEWGFGGHTLKWPFAHIELSGSGMDDDDITLSVCLPWVAMLYVCLQGIPNWEGPGRWVKSSTPPHDLWHRPEQRQIGWSIYEGTLCLDLWNNTMESSNTDPWWWKISINPADILLGRHKYTTRDLSTERVEVPMPEAPYPASVRIFESTWQRPRWPWPRRMVRAEITPDTPIPLPGKGENSWDQDDDATHSLTCHATTAQAAAETLRASVMRDRVRYGSTAWVPDDGWPTL